MGGCSFPEPPEAKGFQRGVSGIDGFTGDKIRIEACFAGADCAPLAAEVIQADELLALVLADKAEDRPVLGVDGVKRHPGVKDAVAAARFLDPAQGREQLVLQRAGYAAVGGQCPGKAPRWM